MATNNATRHWLAVSAVDNPVDGAHGNVYTNVAQPQAKADLLASMEKQLAEFMRTVAQDEEASPPHLMSGHHACPCCSERGE
jgi:glycerate kinase